MKSIKNLVCVLALVSMHSWAYEFNNSTAPYDFTQTLKILILDEKNSKLFGMFDPFEMKVTTMPSRFYAALMGALERGHRNGEGVSLIEGAAAGYEFVLMFRSLNNSHVLFIGNTWIIDGNKKILLSPQEIKVIYDILFLRSKGDQARDLKNLEGLFKKINDLQIGAEGVDQISVDDELKSIIESKKSIEERLPEGYNDTKTLPYYNKALENERFLEEQEKARKLKAENSISAAKQNDAPETVDEVTTAKTTSSLSATAPTVAKAVETEKSSAGEDKNTLINKLILLFILLGSGIAFLYFRKQKHG